MQSLIRMGASAAVSVSLLIGSASFAAAGQAHFVVNAETGSILEADNADELNFPASLTKMMTIYLAFEALKNGTLQWDQKLTVSEHANGLEPFKLAVGAGRQITVREAVMGMVVLSANDAAVVIGETLAGNEPAFGEMMTRKAKALGMSHTVFKNANGLPDPAQVTTARDMATLGLALMRDFPTEFQLFANKTIEFRGMKLRGHNGVMKRYEGVDGIKTGYTDASGYNLVTSAKRGGTRLVAVVMGGKTAQARDDDMIALLDKFLPPKEDASAASVAEPAAAATAATTTN
ncbi:D-alanyl-D-alanine carboxypeptidase family protein [Hyphomicrobiales bacterium]|uniref:D-alanyl-D-alanine carboxypeptidase family protein n=1 Tax=Ensifer sp. R-19 TaxID=3404055 RepID=UPI000DDED416